MTPKCESINSKLTYLLQVLFALFIIATFLIYLFEGKPERDEKNNKLN